MNNVKYLPWVGSQYYNQSLKLLIVGESHYYKEESHKLKEEMNQNFTKEVVAEYLDIKEWKEGVVRWNTRFFTNTYNSLSHLFEEQPPYNKPREFWNKICFYNYIQDFVNDVGFDIAPLYIHNDLYKKALYEVIDSHKPDYIILLSQRISKLWKYEKCGIAKDLGNKFIPARHPSRQALSEEEKRQIYNHIILYGHKCQKFPIYQ